MSSTADKAINVVLSEKADACFQNLLNDLRRDPVTRESAYDMDARPMATAESFRQEVHELRKVHALGVNENAILASIFRDIRVLAAQHGLQQLFKHAYYWEHVHRREMLLMSARRDELFPAIGLLLWGITSRYGTSLLRWLNFGLSIIAGFALVLACISADKTVVTSLLLSVETFCQADYPVTGTSQLERLLLLTERIVGMVYIAFGFGLLLPQLSMELSRTKLSTPAATAPSQPRKD